MSPLLLLVLGIPLARGAPPGADLVGQPVAMVALEATDGGLPGENLEPLLNVRQGEPYRPRDVRNDLAMLQKVGQFAAVEAHLDPWVGYDAEGNPVAAVRVTYRVAPPSRIRKVAVRGSRALARREVVAAAGVARGDAYYEDRDGPVITSRVQATYARRGWPTARVRVSAEPVEGRRVDLRLRVVEGAPERLARLVLVDVPPALDRRVRRACARAGLREGQPFRKDAVVAAREQVLAALQRGGHPRAEVRSVTFPDEAGEGIRLTFVVRPGPRVQVEMAGARGLDTRAERSRIARDLAHEASDEALAETGERLQQGLQAAGWLSARVSVAAEDGADLRTVRVAVDRGRRHHLDSVTFEGAEAYSQRFLDEALREASPEVLGHDRVTAPAVDAAVEALEEYYRSQGYLDARLQRSSLEVGRGTGLGSVPVEVRVQVDEGIRTWLVALDLEGDTGAGLAVVEAVRERLVDQPLNPAALQEVARQVADANWEQGYLLADVRVVTETLENAGQARARLVVEPGPRVFARNVIIQGYRHTRRPVIEREVRLATGEPITPSGLAETRRGLYDLDLFRRVEPVLVGDEDRVRDLLVQVEESPRITFDVGGGASTDEGAEFFVRALHRNLWGTAHRLSLVGETGFAYLGDDWRLDLTRPEWSVGARYEAPHIPGDAQRLLLDVILNEERQYLTWRLARTSLGPGIETALGRSGSLVMDYRVEWRALQDLDPGLLLEQDPWLPLLGLPPSLEGSSFDAGAWPAPVLPSATRRTTGPGFVLVVDQRDDPRNPRRGFRWTLQGRLDDGALSAIPLVTGRTQLAELVPVGRAGILLTLQGGVGTLLGTEGVLPVEERFFLGGTGTLRGHAQDQVGPRNRLSPFDPGFPEAIGPLVDMARRDTPWRYVATGGDAMAAASLELKLPLPMLGLEAWEDAALVGFLDAGNGFLLAPSARTSVAPGDGQPWVRFGTGVGFRYATPVGPLQLDLGINPDPLLDQDEAPWRLHLSLGTL